MVLVRVADYAWSAVRLAGVTAVAVRGADSVCVVGQRRPGASKVSAPLPAMAIGRKCGLLRLVD